MRSLGSRDTTLDINCIDTRIPSRTPTMAWECERCRTVHTQNPGECRQCGHPIFRPLTAAELDQRSEGIEAPETIDLNSVQVMGTEAEPDYPSSPDVAVDGSIKTSVAEQTEPHSNSAMQTISGLIYKTGAVFVAPLLLIRQYLIPILAFLIVSLAIVYLTGLIL